MPLPFWQPRLQSSLAADGETFKVGVVTFPVGQAAEFQGAGARRRQGLVDLAQPGRQAARTYDKLGFGGMKIEIVPVDEAGGATKQVQEFRNLVQRERSMRWSAM
ncbi:MAG: hypothetical protein R3E68_21470 [Burkholderiaceae bacterium]